MINEFKLRELNYKIDEIIEYLKAHNGDNYKLYNHICPFMSEDIEPDSDIVEYALDIKKIINDINKKYPEDLPF